MRWPAITGLQPAPEAGLECRRKTDRQGACLASPRTACANTKGADGRTARKTDEVGLSGRPVLCPKSAARGATACRWTVDFFALLLPAPRAAEAPFAPRCILGETAPNPDVSGVRQTETRAPK